MIIFSRKNARKIFWMVFINMLDISIVIYIIYMLNKKSYKLKTKITKMKQIAKWFMEFTKDSSTETKKWENFIFRANVLLSWAGCLVVIIAVCGICFTSCTSDRKQKDMELGKRLSVLECNQSIELMDMGDYSYLFDRFHYANGIVDLGGIEYITQGLQQNGDMICNLTSKDTTYHYQVSFYKTEALPYQLRVYKAESSPAIGMVQYMEIKKVCGRYRHQVIVGDFEITLMEVKGSMAIICVANNSKKLFAYAEMLPTQGIDPIWQQINFTTKAYQTMNVVLGDRLVLYEYIENEDGIKLKESCRIPYVASLFGL